MKSKSTKLLTGLLIASILATTSVPAAFAATAGAASETPIARLLEIPGSELGDQELDEIHGDGLLATVGGFVGGGLGGAATYTTMYVYKKATKKEASWDWNEFGDPNR